MELAEYFVEGVGRVGRQHAVARVHEGAEGHGQQFVHAVTGDNPGGAFVAVAMGADLAEFAEDGVGIFPEAIQVEIGEGLLHAGGRRVGVFVGVELDEAAALGLFAGYIAFYAHEQFTLEFHWRTSIDQACACNSSDSAKARMSAASFWSRSLE